ncbi:hypothetical protein M9H77_04972 [Catharanthus roseus]|uniref:Uncharacterized protein n=1 Tax=Catharanthus roseus TaxID=4058 RepID=A0ACC0CG22_CATRO|nr:hypothetical protein M9H77_04972 [Catharanthus roseus]
MDVHHEDNLASRVASFSHYLKTSGDQENLVQKINGSSSYGSSSHRNIASFPSLLDDPPENFAFKVKPGPITSEIGVFGADKYFNMKLDNGRNKLQKMKSSSNSSSRSAAATQSVYSEITTSSSWNSGTALLKNNSNNILPRKTSQTTKPKMALGRRIIASFGCTGPCMDSRSAIVAENGRRGGGDIGRGECQIPFAFPIIGTSTNDDDPSTKTKKQHIEEVEKIEELRKSLDVFGSDTMKKRGEGDNIIVTNLERKLSMLTWDAIPIPKPSNHHHSTTTVGSSTTTIICDDMASDASSDLFEIENISSSGNGLVPILSNINHKNDDDDDLLLSGGYGCMSPTTTQYAPSEASIEWSVVTASAVDFSSVISDYDEKYIGFGGTSDGNKKNLIKQSVGKDQAQKTRSSGLLGCKSQKSVNVAETQVHKTRVERY